MFYIYAMQHNVTNRLYVGCTKRNIKFRFQDHIKELKGRRHRSGVMQADFDEYGADFSIFLLEKGKNRAIWIGKKFYTLAGLKEKGWMKKLDSVNSGYNTQDLLAKRMIRSNQVNLEEYVK